MRMRVHPVLLCAGVLALGLLAGCGKSSTGNTSSSGSSNAQGKTYRPDSKAGAKGAGAAAASDAETVDGKPSAASDDGSPEATKGRPVANPGAPAPHAPNRH